LPLRSASKRMNEGARNRAFNIHWLLSHVYVLTLTLKKALTQALRSGGPAQLNCNSRCISASGTRRRAEERCITGSEKLFTMAVVLVDRRAADRQNMTFQVAAASGGNGLSFEMTTTRLLCAM